MPTVDRLTEKAPYLPHGRLDNIAKAITSDVNPNTISLVVYSISIALTVHKTLYRDNYRGHESTHIMLTTHYMLLPSIWM